MRQSTAPLRQSHLPGPATNAASAAKLLEKKKEYEAVVALERASTQFLKRIESLGDDFDVIADAGIGMLPRCMVYRFLTVGRTVHGQVLEQWPHMFKILSLFCMSCVSHICFRSRRDKCAVSSREQAPGSEEPTSHEFGGERLVRVPLEELQATDRAA